MPADRKFRLQLLESRKAQASERKRDRIARAKPETSARAVLRSLKETTGAEDILKRVPDEPSAEDILQFSRVGNLL